MHPAPAGFARFQTGVARKKKQKTQAVVGYRYKIRLQILAQVRALTL